MRMTIGILSMLALVVTACYPDESYEENLREGSIRLPLSTIGISTDSDTVQNWLTWAGGGFDADPFDMGVQGNNFALDLRLYSKDTNSYQPFTGTRVAMDTQNGGETLLVDLKINQCTDCRFYVSLFWKQDPAAPLVTVFDGQSPEFSTTGSSGVVDIPEFSIIQTGSGTVTCNKGDNEVPDGAWVAVRDENANIRFPHVEVDGSKQPAAVLLGIPTSHDMVVELDPLSDGRFYSPFADVLLHDDGESVEIELP